MAFAGLLAGATVVVGGCQTGIPFFSELQTDDEGDGGETTEGELSCGVEDDLCLSQDTLQSCANGGEDPELFDCGALCGSFVNATCLHVGNGLHGCWCVDPGDYKTLSCTELESCLAGCDEDATGECGQECFGRTTAQTGRLYGALVHCAESECRDTCLLAPAACEECYTGALNGLTGSCVVERSLCDDDRNDDEWP